MSISCSVNRMDAHPLSMITTERSSQLAKLWK